MPSRVPGATYRLQFTKEFGFDAAADLVPYLRDLGITHLYASPFLKARTGSTHGYDVVDHNRLDPQFGGDAAFQRLSRALAKADLGLILDFVPNHMGVGHEDNAWWLDVLEWGMASPYATFFDIDWWNVPGRNRPGVVLPILGKPYGEVLGGGEFKLTFDDREGNFSIWYFQHRLPVRPDSYASLIQQIFSSAELRSGRIVRELLDISAAHAGRKVSHSAAAEMKSKLAHLPGAKELIEEAIGLTFRAAPEQPEAVRHLHRLLQRQHYLPSYWRSSKSEINYRRFFDINDLAGLRVEDEEVFSATHRLVGDLIQSGSLHGLRLDHVDGLYDPVGYCRRLSDLVGGRTYTVVEKILGEGEELLDLPGVAGTTGYEWMNVLTRCFIRDDGIPILDEVWRDFTGRTETLDEMTRAAKREVMSSMFAGELATLVRLLRRIAAGHWESQDLTGEQLRSALEAYVVALPVYRTYVTPETEASEQDRFIIASTLDAAQRNEPALDPGLFGFLGRLLSLDLIRDTRSGYSRRRVARFVGKLQQFTGPIMAKSLEDTCFYRYLRLLALNEVGGHPDAGSMEPAAFHEAMQHRAEQRPHDLTATATHDSKRGEDARARLAALSELADEWKHCVRRWREDNAHCITHSDHRSPSPDHEYLLYQAMLGAWPVGGPDEDFANRLTAFAIKAIRESKQETSWHAPNEEYEAGVTEFVRRLLEPDGHSRFLAEFGEFARRVALLGCLNSLGQITLKLTMPGVPDIYQGCELWDLSFVDPDNRRPVDFDLRRGFVAAKRETPNWKELSARWPDGQIKMTLLERLLRLRSDMADVFQDGAYIPLDVEGRDDGSVLAFSRHLNGRNVVVVVARFLAERTAGGRQWPGPDGWSGLLALPSDAAYRNALTGEDGHCKGVIDLAGILRDLPVAVLRDDSAST